MAHEPIGARSASGALAAFEWIRDWVLMGQGEAALVESYGQTDVPPTRYRTSVTDLDKAMDGDKGATTDGLDLILDVSTIVRQPEVVLGGKALAIDEEFRFDVANGDLILNLSVTDDTCQRLTGLYRQARVTFSPSGGSFTGLITATCESAVSMLRWTGKADGS